MWILCIFSLKFVPFRELLIRQWGRVCVSPIVRLPLAPLEKRRLSRQGSLCHGEKISIKTLSSMLNTAQTKLKSTSTNAPLGSPQTAGSRSRSNHEDQPSHINVSEFAATCDSSLRLVTVRCDSVLIQDCDISQRESINPRCSMKEILFAK